MLKTRLDNSVAAAVTATKQGVAKLFYRDGVKLEFNQTDNDLMKVSFWLSDLSPMPLSACLSIKNGQPASCPDSSAKITWDQNGQFFEIFTVLKSPQAFGLTQINRAAFEDGESFCDISDSAMTNKILYFQLGYNQLEGILNIFSGSAAILDQNKKPLFQGNVSLKD